MLTNIVYKTLIAYDTVIKASSNKDCTCLIPEPSVGMQQQGASDVVHSTTQEGQGCVESALDSLQKNNSSVLSPEDIQVQAAIKLFKHATKRNIFFQEMADHQKKLADDQAAEILKLQVALKAAHDRETGLEIDCKNAKMHADEETAMVLELESELMSARKREELLKVSSEQKDECAKKQAAVIAKLVASLRAAEDTASTLKDSCDREKRRADKKTATIAKLKSALKSCHKKKVSRKADNDSYTGESNQATQSSLSDDVGSTAVALPTSDSGVDVRNQDQATILVSSIDGAVALQSGMDDISSGISQCVEPSLLENSNSEEAPLLGAEIRAGKDLQRVEPSLEAISGIEMAPQLIIDARASGTIQESEPVLKATCVSGDAHAESKGVNATSKTVYAIKDPASDLSTKTVAESVYKLEKERADKLSDQVQKLEMTLNAACVTETLLLYAWKCEKKRANEQEKRADMEAERAKKETIRACSEKTATVNSKASLDETIKRVEALQTTLSETRDSETSLRSAWQTEILQTKEEQTRADELEKHAQKLTVQIQELEQRLSDAHANEAVIGHNCEQMRNRIDELMLRGNEAVIHAENETRRAQELSNNVQLLEKSLSEAQMSEAAVRHDCEQMRKKLDELVVNYNNLDTHAQNETKRANYLNDCACREQKIAKFHAQRADNEARRADDEKRRADAEEMCANKQADLVQYQMMVADLHNERAHIANTNANEQTERAKMVVTQAQENEANLINKYSRVKSHADWATDRVQELEDNLRTGNVANVDSHPQTYDYANETARKRRMVSESRPCKTAKSVAANVRIVAPGENDVASASQF